MPFSILQWNSRGLIGKWAEAKPMFLHNNYQLICIQESHFMDNDKYQFKLPRFTSYHAYSPNGGRGGGVSTFVSDNFPHYRVPIHSRLQAVVCSVLVYNQRVSVCSLYLPPSDMFFLHDLVQLMNELPKPFIICTDANSKHYMWGSPTCDARGDIWMDAITQGALCLLNDGQATRLDDFSGTESHIDLTVSTSDLAPKLKWNTIKDLHSSDHFPIVTEMGVHVDPDLTLPPIFTGWNMHQADWVNFQADCPLHFDVEGGLDNCDIMTQTIVNAALKYVPTRKANPKFSCPWWNDSCREALRERRRAQNRMRRNPYSDFLRIEYRKAKAKARRTVREAQVASWRSLISVFNHRTPMTKLRDILRKFNHRGRISRPYPVLMRDGVVVDEPSEVANAFGIYFSELCGQAQYSDAFIRREQTTVASIPEFGNANNEEYNKEFTFRELTDAIHDSGSTSVGPDKVHYDFFRHLNDQQLTQMLLLFNYIWSRDVFPASWRHSYIVPILKPGKDCTQVSSYRPIQLTSCVSKLMERMIARRFGWCLEKYELLSQYQCAFRKGRSTTDHLVRLDSHIRDGFIHHSTTLAVFLDLKSAYNRVSPAVLIHRLYALGFRGHMLHFVQSYLTDRTFQVRCGVLSDVYAQETGLVQGGVLSPMLFYVAIDTVFDTVPRGISYAIYADDCTLWAQGRNIPVLFQTVQRALNEVGQWSLDHGFTFSAGKSTAIIFRRCLKRLDPASLPLLSISGDPIDMSDCVKYLGVLLDAKLNMGAHVRYTKARALKRIALLKCIAGKGFGADRVVLLRMYKALIRPILEYAAAIVDGPGNRLVESLECVQNTALRIATGALRTSPVRSMQIDTDICPLSLRRKELTLRYFLKIQAQQK